MSSSAPPIAALPSGTALPPAGPSSPAKPLPVTALVAALPSNIDVFLARLNKALSTPTGIDTVMLFLCYTSRFSASLLSHLSASLLRRSAREWLALVASLPRGTTVLFAAPNPGAKPTTSAAGAAALVLASRLKALSGLLSEARMILRLWALLGMYFWGKGLIAKALKKSTPEEKAKGPSQVETAIEWTRLGLCIGLQSLENGAYLSQRGVMGWSPKTQGLAYKWSARFWAAYVGIELGRLLVEGFGGGKVYQAEETAEWRKKVVRNTAWMPLTIHWSTDAGIVNDTLVGLLASIPGIIQIRDLWATTKV
ncbi:hypothetical protein B0T14DRAFT_516352 [Immersiella caudata]|uniref:Peroxin 11C n=1 Tax=Immersiella caudata TaxID=314043 RepID=A0AA40C3A5_9PEZI|nr:hypothetical protein B0T14DRAFT_516352 [Immersiella caudata]